MKLYSYWRSTTAYRVRAALNLKGLSYETIPVDLAAGDQRADAFRQLNPGLGVPVLVLEDGRVLSQSMAILEYLDEAWPSPRLLPDDPFARAQTRALAQIVAADIHPINNLRVAQAIQARFGASGEDVQAWMQHWMALGFDAAEAMIAPDRDFALGDAPGLADLCLVAQVYNARRWGVDLHPYPRLARVEENCLALPAIAAAHPDQQPDAKETV